MNAYDFDDAQPIRDVPAIASKIPFLVILSFAVVIVLAFSVTAPPLIQRHAIEEFHTEWSEYNDDADYSTQEAIREAHRLRALHQ